MEKTTRLIRWQRITIFVLFLAFLSMAFASSYQARKSEIRLQESERWRQRVIQYEAERQQYRLNRLMPADIEYLRWFQQFDRACLQRSKQQAHTLGLALHSSEVGGLERAILAATKQGIEDQSRFQQKLPPLACQSIASLYAQRLELMTGQVRARVALWMVLSSRGYSIDSPQGRNWSEAMRDYSERERDRDFTHLQRLKTTTDLLNAALEQLSHTDGTPLPQDLARLRVRWMGISEYE
jgi:hypothetical protein